MVQSTTRRSCHSWSVNSSVVAFETAAEDGAEDMLWRNGYTGSL